MIWKALDLQDLTVLDRPRCADNRIARADQQIRIEIDGTRTVLQPADEAIMQAAEALLTRLAQIQIGEQPPDSIDRSRTSGCSILLNQPKKRVASRLGMRLVSRKLTSS